MDSSGGVSPSRVDIQWRPEEPGVRSGHLWGLRDLAVPLAEQQRMWVMKGGGELGRRRKQQ